MKRSLIALAFAASSIVALTGIVVAKDEVEGCAAGGQRQPRRGAGGLEED